MCQFASGFINPKTFKVRVWDLDSHGETMEHLKLKDGNRPDGWREMHYLPDGDVSCQVLEIDRHSAKECEEAVRKRWPRFVDFFNWALPQTRGYTEGTYGGWLYLRGCDLKGVKLPQTVGGSLYLSGCTNTDKLDTSGVKGDVYC